MYTPQNLYVFTAAYAGALAGMGVSDRVPTDTNIADYEGLADVAGAFAQAFDTAWGPVNPSLYHVQTIQETCEAVWEGRSPQPVAPFLTPNTYARLSLAIIAIVKAGAIYFIDNGIPFASISTGTTSTFVYQPGGTAGANVFTDWATMMAAVGLVAGPKIIQIDNSKIAPLPAVIPAGNWNMADCELWGILPTPSSAGPQGQCADGCKLLNLFMVTNNLSLTSISTSSVRELLDNDVFYINIGSAVDSEAGAFPFIDASPATPYINNPTIVVGVGGSVGSLGNPTIKVSDVTVGLQALIIDTLGTIANNTVVGLGTFEIIYTSIISLITGPSLPPTQTGVTAFHVIDLTSYHKQNYFCESATLVAPSQVIPPGYALAPSSTAPPAGSQAGWRGDLPGLLTVFEVVMTGGGVANAGLQVTFQLNLDGVPIPGATLNIPADTGGGNAAQFPPVAYNGHDVTLTATPSGALVAPITSINSSVN